MEDGNSYRILSVNFSEEWVEITFLEQREQSDDVREVRSRAIRPRLFQAQVDELLDSLTELVDDAAVHRRNPVASFRRPRRTDDDVPSGEDL